MPSSPAFRFAPSPTGYLHLGNLRTALFNFLAARASGGRFILRIDDTDPERCREIYVDALIADLDAFSLTPDLCVRQSRRGDLYAAAARRLKEAGRLYPAYETPEELERKRRLALAQRRPPIYDRAALRLNEAEREAFEAEGRRPHWRFRLSGGSARFFDVIQGETVVDTAHQSDPVLIRADGRMLYALPSVVDDIDLGVTTILRGADHRVNAGLQAEIFTALGAETPTFAHHGLLRDAGGENLSKRSGSHSVRAWREAGLEIDAILGFLFDPNGKGAPDGADPATLAANFDIAALGGGDIVFDEAALQARHRRTLHGLSHARAAPRLRALGPAAMAADADFWMGVRGDLSRFDEVAEWWRILREPLTPIIDDPELCRRARESLPPEPWTPETMRLWLRGLATASDRRGKALFLPLRRALTGRDRGPDMACLLALTGAERTAGRFEGKTV